MLYTCIIIDDEGSAIFHFEEIVAQAPQLMLLRSFTSLLDAKLWLQKNGEVHIIFLDIEMPLIDGVTGTEMLRGWYKRLIYVTAHEQYAAKAFGLGASDFLIKPVTTDKLVLSLDRMTTDIAISREEQLLRVRSRFINTYQGKLTALALEDIQYISADGDYVQVHTADQKHTLHVTLKQIHADLLPLIPLRQISRFHLVSLEFVESILGDKITMKNDDKLVVTGTYRQKFLNDVRFLSYGGKRS